MGRLVNLVLAQSTIRAQIATVSPTTNHRLGIYHLDSIFKFFTTEVANDVINQRYNVPQRTQISTQRPSRSYSIPLSNLTTSAKLPFRSIRKLIYYHYHPNTTTTPTSSLHPSTQQTSPPPSSSNPPNVHKTD